MKFSWFVQLGNYLIVKLVTHSKVDDDDKARIHYQFQMVYTFSHVWLFANHLKISCIQIFWIIIIFSNFLEPILNEFHIELNNKLSLQNSFYYKKHSFSCFIRILLASFRANKRNYWNKTKIIKTKIVLIRFSKRLFYSYQQILFDCEIERHGMKLPYVNLTFLMLA